MIGKETIISFDNSITSDWISYTLWYHAGSLHLWRELGMLTSKPFENANDFKDDILQYFDSKVLDHWFALEVVEHHVNREGYVKLHIVREYFSEPKIMETV